MASLLLNLTGAHSYRLLDASSVWLLSLVAYSSLTGLYSTELPINHPLTAHSFTDMATQCLVDGLSAPHPFQSSDVPPIALPAMTQFFLQPLAKFSMASDLWEV